MLNFTHLYFNFCINKGIELNDTELQFKLVLLFNGYRCHK